MKSAPEAFVNSFVKSFQEHPSLTAFVILMCSALFGYSVHVFAEKTELAEYISKTDRRFQTLEMRIDRLDYGILSRNLESEIFDLERIIERGEGREIDHRRLKKLQSQLRDAERKMNMKRIPK